MTKSRKPAAITFPVTFRTTHQVVRTNAETGIEIRSNKLDNGTTEYGIWRLDREGTLSWWCSEDTLKGARELATEIIEMVREQVAMDHADALEMDEAETVRVVAEIIEAIEQAEARVAGCPAARAVKALLYRARCSAEAPFPFIAAARNRLARALRILSGEEAMQSDAQADAALAAAAERFPVGALVRTEGGTGRVCRLPIIVTEENRVSVLLYFPSTCCVGKSVRGGYSSRYVTEVEAV